MHIETTRRGFIGLGSATVLAGMAGAGGAIGLLQQQPASPSESPAAAPPDAAQPNTTPQGQWERPAALKPEDVQAVVGAAHRDIDKVRSLLDAQPSLVNATWDWGSGDFESPLGAAGHTGQVEIAELVLSRGACIELHCAAMLGWLELIKSAVAARTGAENILGPHAIPMHSHAREGGDRAAAVLEYLESLNCLRDIAVSEATRNACAGRYRVEGSDDELLVIVANRRMLLQPPTKRPWYLLHQGEGVYRPADATQVKLSFEMNADGSQSKAMLIDEGNDQATAVRVA